MACAWNGYITGNLSFTLFVENYIKIYVVFRVALLYLLLNFHSLGSLSLTLVINGFDIGQYFEMLFLAENLGIGVWHNSIELFLRKMLKFQLLWNQPEDILKCFILFFLLLLQVKKLDVLSNELFINLLTSSYTTCLMVSLSLILLAILRASS